MSDDGEKSIEALTAEFHQLMGQAIANWAEAEAFLFKIFRAALGVSSQRAAIIFSHARQIEARRQLTDAILATRLPPRPQNGGTEDPDTRQWRELSKTIQELLRTRNMIAHQPMDPHLDWDEDLDGGVGKTEFWYEITSSEIQRARDGGPGETLDVDDLRAHINQVSSLKDRLHSFYAHTLSRYVRLLP